MSRPPDRDHEWFRRHLPEHLLDLLVEGEQKRFNAHARRCSPCAQLLASALGAKADWWDGAGHPPVGVLLAWDPSDRGARTDDTVRSHLAHCEDCRRDLEDLRGAEVARAVAPAPAPAPRPLVRDRRWLAPSWGGLATATGAVVAVSAAVILWPRPAGHAPRPVVESVPVLRGAPAVPAPGLPAPPPAQAPAPGNGLTAAPVTLGANDRGAGAGPVEIRIEAGVTSLPLTLPTLPVADDAMLVVELRDSAGVLVQRQVLVAGRALQPGGIVLSAEGLAGGPHRLVLRYIDPASGETSREFPLDVRISRAR